MRASFLTIMASAVMLGGCAQMIAQSAGKDAHDKFLKCSADNKVTPEGQVIAKRIWLNDSTDRAEKLSDPNPLTPMERDALVQVQNRGIQCRQIIINYDNQYAAWETPYLEELFQRTDQIVTKLASGELPVGTANKLIIESNGRFQVDVSKGHADAVAANEAAQQRAAELLIQSGALKTATPRPYMVPPLQAPQPAPRMTTTNCTWLGNNLSCTSM